MSDAAEFGNTATRIFTRALDFCGRRIGVAAPQEVVARLRAEDAAASGYFRYALAAGVAAQLGDLDHHILAVYLYDDAETAEECWEDATPLASPIHLIVRAEPATAALKLLVDALDSALLPQFTALLGRHHQASLLAVDVVDDAALAGRRGAAVLLTSTRYAPLRVWQAQA